MTNELATENNQHDKELIIQWAYTYLSANGYTLESNLPEDIQNKPWSYVVRFATTAGYIYLKHTPKLIALEADITKILRDQFHASVPEVIAHNAELNCFLTKDAGWPLRQILKKKFEVTLLCKAIHQFTSMQMNVADHVDVFLNIGVPDWRLDKLAALFAKFLSQKELLLADGLSEMEINYLETLLPKISDLCKKLSDFPIKQTIVQPDFHDNNLLIDAQKNITIIDLGEITITHPFFSLITCLAQVKKHHAVIAESEEYVQVLFACLKNYMDIEPKEDLFDAFSTAQILWYVYAALANDRLIKACVTENILLFQPGRLSSELKEFISVLSAV